MEVLEEASYVRQHEKRVAYFFSAMRHFRVELEARGRHVHYIDIEHSQNSGTLEGEIARLQEQLKPSHSIALEPGDWRVRDKLRRLRHLPKVRADRHFLCGTEKFARFLSTHPRPIMETFYRFMRRETGLLMDPRGKPIGSAWNFDSDNRRALNIRQRESIPVRLGFRPDQITRDVLEIVKRKFPQSPGKLENFDLPVSRAEALLQLREFVSERLPLFGTYQDAMLGGEHLLYHSFLSGPLNLHMVDPSEIVSAALESSSAPLNSLEGFIRQIIGWREFVRGIYWQRMPGYAAENALSAELPMPVSTGPGRPSCDACRKRSATPSIMRMPIISSG